MGTLRECIPSTPPGKQERAGLRDSVGHCCGGSVSPAQEGIVWMESCSLHTILLNVLHSSDVQVHAFTQYADFTKLDALAS